MGRTAVRPYIICFHRSIIDACIEEKTAKILIGAINFNLITPIFIGLLSMIIS
jgi:hypothetical protein